MAKAVSYSQIKSKILQPALTTHYELSIDYSKLKGWLDGKFGSIFSGRQMPSDMGDILSISCSEATIPGSTFFTHEIQNDRTGVTEKIPYRRVYDDQASFTFYVDTNYNTLVFFESWMSYIANEEYGTSNSTNIKTQNYFYRMRYPEDNKNQGNTYKIDMILTKFERNNGVKNESPRELKYIFMDAYPISISSIPISYDNASLLKVNVSFAFTRYYLQ